MEEIDGSIFKDMMLRAADQISFHESILNELNYFPVRDKDTGTNLRILFENIRKGIENVEINHIGKILEIIKDISMKVSKGNSGNIISMFFYGLYIELKDKKKVKLRDLFRAIKRAREYAYSSVKEPKEGTMLTVIRVMERELVRSKNLRDWLDKCIRKSLRELENKRENINLKRTIDSGGLGIVLMLKGWIESIGGDIKINLKRYLKEEKFKRVKGKIFCLNILARPKYSIDKIKDRLRGEDSLIINEFGDYVKIHLHTRSVEDTINLLIPFVEIENIEIDEING